MTSEPAPPDGVVVWATSVQCAGDEAALSDCPAQWSNTYLGYDVHECTGGAYVGVACQNTLQRRPKVADAFDGNLDQEQGAGEAVPAALPTDAPVETVPLVVSGNGSLVVTPVGLLTINPELRLLLESAPVRIMGSTPYTGQVEVFVEDRWTAICDSYWNDEDASVVCRQMGFSGGQASGEACRLSSVPKRALGEEALPSTKPCWVCLSVLLTLDDVCPVWLVPRDGAYAHGTMKWVRDTIMRVHLQLVVRYI